MFYKKILMDFKQATKTEFKVGIVGCGHIGSIILTEILNLGIVEASDI